MPPDSFPAGRRKGSKPMAAARRCACVAFRCGQTEEGREEGQVLADADLLIEIFAESLRHIGNARADGAAMPGIVHATAEDLTDPVCILRAPAIRPSSVDFPGVRADDARHLAARQCERYSVERWTLP
jgi:hypothetical protein